MWCSCSSCSSNGIRSRKGKYGYDGSVNPMPGSNIPLAALGAWILWLGWFGFNNGSELAVASGGGTIAVSEVFLNTNMAAAGGGSCFVNELNRHRQNGCYYGNKWSNCRSSCNHS